MLIKPLEQYHVNSTCFGVYGAFDGDTHVLHPDCHENHIIGATIVTIDAEPHYCILASPTFMLFPNSVRRALVHHEAGHIMLDHPALFLDYTDQRYEAERNECTVSGEVHPWEAAADDFAHSILGEEYVVGFTQFMHYFAVGSYARREISLRLSRLGWHAEEDRS